MNKHKIQPHWWSKSAAGVLLGYTLALALSGLFAWLSPDGINPGNKSQFIMWIIAPIWMCTLSASYLFRTGIQAWYWLSSANVIAYALLLLTKELMT